MEPVSRSRNVVAALSAVALLTVAVGVAGGAGSASLRVEGVVMSVAAGSLEIRADGGQAMTFRLVATTAYVKGGQAVQQSEVRVGDRVRVKYHLESNGTLKAKEVSVEPPPTPLLFAEGSISAISADQLIVFVGGVSKTFRLTSGTTYSSNGQPIPVSAFRPGVRVRVEYHADPDGSLRAKEVALEQLLCASVPEVARGWEVVLGYSSTVGAARARVRRFVARGFKVTVERESCRVYEVEVRVPTRRLADSVAVKARRLGLRPRLERR